MAVLTPLDRPQERPTTRSIQRGVLLETPLISVVIVNFCQWANTTRLAHQLAESITQSTGLSEVQIINNGPALTSTPDLAGCRLHHAGSNLGFAKAVNEAALRTTGEWILLLNPDTDLPTGFLDQLAGLCRTLDDETPEVGVVGLSLKHADGSPQASSGKRPTFWRTLAGLLRPRRTRKCQHQPPAVRTTVDWVTGCGMLIRRTCWQQLGGFHPDFFLYYEDTDFCTRATQAGWDVVYEPSISLRHLHPLHTRHVPPELRLMTRHALLTFAKRYWPARHQKALITTIWIEAISRSVLARFRGQATQPHAAIQALAADWWTGNIAMARERVEMTAQQLHAIMSPETTEGTPC